MSQKMGTVVLRGKRVLQHEIPSFNDWVLKIVISIEGMEVTIRFLALLSLLCCITASAEPEADVARSRRGPKPTWARSRRGGHAWRQGERWRVPHPPCHLPPMRPHQSAKRLARSLVGPVPARPSVPSQSFPCGQRRRRCRAAAAAAAAAALGEGAWPGRRAPSAVSAARRKSRSFDAAVFGLSALRAAQAGSLPPRALL